MPETDPSIRVAVLGGGFAGLEFCRTLRDPRFSITLIDRQNHHLFQPLLYQVATAGLAATEIAQPLRSILSGRKNVTVLMEEVTGLELAAGRVQTNARIVEFDYLVIALGVRTGYFGHAEWESHAVGLKSLDDALRIRSDVLAAFERAEGSDDPAEAERLLTTVVVGGGPTGVEMAGALAELARHVLRRDFRRIDPARACVHLVEAGARLLPTFAPELSEYTRRTLANLGVTVHLNAPVENVAPGAVHLRGGTVLRAANVVWAAGVEAPALTKLLPGIPLDRAGRIAVEPDLSLPGFPHVFAAGDIVSLVDARRVRVPGVAPAASQMGRHIAKLLVAEARHRERFTSEPQRRPFVYWDKGNMATIGRTHAVAQTRRMKVTGFIAWCMWLFIHLLFLVGFRNRVAVFLQWAYAYITWRRGARIIPHINPRYSTER